jgi:[ribosomal protein S18]-alanine N-acetyltransferase
MTFGGAVTIRPATSADLSAILSVEASSRSVSWTADGFKQELSEENTIGLIAQCDGGAACGYVLSRCAADECTVHTIAVIPSRQRQGIGRKLMDTMSAQAAQRCRCATLFLEVRSRNRGAIAFYEALGFLPQGTRKAYYADDGDDAIIMRRARSACNACNL